VARSVTIDTSGPPASVTSCPPRDPPLVHFENKEVSTFLHFPISYLSQGNHDLKPSTARQTGPRWIIPKASGLRNFCTRINDCTNLSNLRFSKKTEVLKLHKILRRRPTFLVFPARIGLSRPDRCKNGILYLLGSQHLQTCVNHSN
jgi:hypothetical protein